MKSNMYNENCGLWQFLIQDQAVAHAPAQAKATELGAVGTQRHQKVPLAVRREGYTGMTTGKPVAAVAQAQASPPTQALAPALAQALAHALALTQASAQALARNRVRG